jgi:putative tryptophan/tyrosine transport system substrate-binding protein
VRRRELLLGLLGAVALEPHARGQPAERVYRVGWLAISDDQRARANQQAFLEVLQQRGYTIGHNLEFNVRSANGEPRRFPELVRELIALKPDVLAGIEEVAKVMVSQTLSIPIVLLNSSDPVAVGLVRSLAHPGGNVTGVSLQFGDLVLKHMELMREIIPQLARVGQFNDINVPSAKVGEEHTRQAAKILGLEYIPYYFANRADVERAFAEMEKDPPGALLPAVGSGLLYSLRDLTVGHTTRMRIPSSSTLSLFPEMGTLMSYGPDLVDGFRLAATYVDRILKGANPGDLPVEQPSKFELVINLKAAKQLGLTIPHSVLVRATRVIE